MKHHIIRKILKVLMWTLISVAALLIIIPVLLYIPFVQDFARKIAVEKVSESTGMKISVGELRLRFPLRLNVADVEIIEASGDTMLTARSLAVDVKLRPLFKGVIDVSGATLTDATYGMGNRDSVMMLRAAIGLAQIDGTDVDLSGNKIMIDKARIDGADIYMRLLPDTTAAPVDTAAAAPWFIHADDITLANVRYRMEMLPTIDSLGCTIQKAQLLDGTVDMASHRIHGHSLAVDSVAATYLLPPVADSPVADTTAPADTTSTEAWTITADRLSLTGREATYAIRGAVPQPGLDMNYIQANDIVIEVDSFYNRATAISVPIRRISATERCGLALRASGLFAMDSAMMRVSGFNIDTQRSSLAVDAGMGMGDLATDPTLPLMLNAYGLLSPADVAMAFPAMKLMMSKLEPVSLDAAINGTAGLLDVERIKMSMPGVFNVNASGQISNPMVFDRLGGKVNISGSTGRLTPRFSSLMALDTAIHIPAMKINGAIDYNPSRIDGRVALSTGDGRMALAGKWAERPQQYDATLKVDAFPVDAFMPSLGIRTVTADMTASGKGLNFLSAKTNAKATVNIAEIIYHGDTYSDITLDASIADGEAAGRLSSNNPGAKIFADFAAAVKDDTISYRFDGDVSELDLQKLHFADTLNYGSLVLKSEGRYGVKNGFIDAEAAVSNLSWMLPGTELMTPQIKLNLLSADSLLEAALNNGDLNLRLYSTSPLTDFITRLSNAADVATKQIDDRAISIDSISKALPFIDMILNVGSNNIVSNYLMGESDIAFKTLTAGLHNDSILSLNARLVRLATASMNLDTISFNAVQQGRYLIYSAAINNRPGTMDEFAHVDLRGFVASNRLSLFLKQQNIKEEKGFSIGFNAEFNDTTVSLRFVPYKPTIAYKQWTINRDNFITYNFFNQRLAANLALENDKSFLKLYTDRAPADSVKEFDDVVLEISDIHIQDWLSISPFAPPIKGDLSADMRFNWDRRMLTGKGSIGLTDLYNGRDRVGSFDLDVNLVNSPGGTVNADITLMVDSIKTITARGALNDSTAPSPFLLDFSMIKFPLRVVNPFLPPQMAKLSGMLNGNMTITGDMAMPVFNGYIDFDSTAVKVGMLGTTFNFSEEKIPVDSNIVHFNNFTISGCNENPLRVNGVIDLRHLSDIAVNLDLSAENFQIVNSSRPRGADVYGKAFLNIGAKVSGDMQRLQVDAEVDLLSGTNVTYVVPETTSALTSRSNSEMVHFVQFNDTAQVIRADSIVNSSMTLNLDAQLRIQEGTVICVDLSADGKNRAQIEAQGDLDYSMTGLNGQRLTGRINLNKGFVRYTPPLMSEKLFNFQEGSYVAFNGDIMNPILHLSAIDRLRANVTQSGQNSRLVYFDVILNVTGSLENMNVAFDLSTDDDLTVENELTSMTPDQRANQAMNLLLYNVYSGGSTKATSNLSGNALYSILTSRINSWAANNIKGVDLSFGIDQYDKTYQGNTSTTTSYSYRVSKSLFNDRIKIIVGGNYSTDADADQNLSQNLINDISIEYLINKSGSMYIRIFRHTGYESILEGEVTQTGVGFVFRRKLNSLRELFGRKPKIEQENGK